MLVISWSVCKSVCWLVSHQCVCQSSVVLVNVLGSVLVSVLDNVSDSVLVSAIAKCSVCSFSVFCLCVSSLCKVREVTLLGQCVSSVC